MILGKKSKEDIILDIFLYVFLLSVLVAGIVFVSIFIDKLALKISLIIILSLLIIFLSYLPFYLYKNVKTSDNIITYNSVEETIIINGFKKNYVINISDIAAITVHNLGMILLLANRMEEGKLYFYLNDGTKIKTANIDNVYEVYGKLDEIIFIDREYENVMKDQLIDKLDGWGAKREYPSIVSVLIALFVPFFGVWFVSNQKEFKELKNGKATGLMAVALVISAFWAFAIIIALALL